MALPLHMRRPLPYLLCALALTFVTACETKPVDEGADTDANTESSTESSTGGDTMGPLDGEGPPDTEAYAAVCAAQATQADCAAVEGEEYPGDATVSCEWYVAVPYTYVDGVCSFGEPTSYCEMDSASAVGCAGPANLCGEQDLVSRVTTVDGVATLILGGSCSEPECLFDDQGMLVDGPPECACFCDPSFPG